MTTSRQLPRRRPASSRGRDDVITCSRTDCAHPLHVHRDVAQRNINISDNDSDLLISIDDNQSQILKNESNSSNSVARDEMLGSSTIMEEKIDTSGPSGSKDSDSGIGKTQKGCSITSDHKQNESYSQVIDDMDACKSPDIKTPKSKPDQIVRKTRANDLRTHLMQSPSFQRVGFSQCKPGKTVKCTRLIEGTDSYPEPVYVEKENLRRRVVFESPKTPIDISSAKRRSLNVLETPESGPGNILVEDTPEHLVGLRMVTRRLRRVLQQTVPDSLNC